MIAAAAIAAVVSATNVGVGAREYRFAVYRPVVDRGTIALNLHDFGEDAHDVQVRGPHGYRSAVSPDVLPGEDLRFVVHLRHAGRYTLVCLKPGHLARGMKATLTVR